MRADTCLHETLARSPASALSAVLYVPRLEPRFVGRELELDKAPTRGDHRARHDGAGTWYVVGGTVVGVTVVGGYGGRGKDA